MPSGSQLILADLKLKVVTSGGVCAFFDTRIMRHGTEECKPSASGEAACMGIALHCKSNVSGAPPRSTDYGFVI